MHKTPLYRSWVAGLLTLLFVTMWCTKTMHGLFYHADHHDRPVCTAERDHAAAHIHDTRYATNDCSFCALVFHTPALSVLTALSLSPRVKPPAKICLLYQPPCTRLAVSAVPSRGPPAS